MGNDENEEEKEDKTEPKKEKEEKGGKVVVREESLPVERGERWDEKK